MTIHKYSSKIENEHTAKAVGRNLNISIKNSTMVCNQLRNRNLQKSKELLQRVIKKEQAIPYTRFNFDRGHKKKIGPGRYPIKTAKAILEILESVESNAQFKGLNTSLLKIVHINAHRASTPQRYGRKGGVSSKRSHVEVIVEEKPEEMKKDKKSTKQEKVKQEDKRDKQKISKETEKEQDKPKENKREVKEEKKIKETDKKESKPKEKEENTEKTKQEPVKIEEKRQAPKETKKTEPKKENKIGENEK